MLIALAHGSRSPAWRASVERQFELIRAELGSGQLQLAYMDLAPPTLMDVVEAAVQHGITQIRVLPLFLAAEGHVTKDVKPLIDEVRVNFELVEIDLLPPIGQHPLFREMLRSLAMEEAP
jgi:sirohydrochlorin cobaltochelatase